MLGYADFEATYPGDPLMAKWQFQIAKPDLTITVNRADLNRVLMGVAGFDQLASEGKAKLEGNREIIHKLRDLMVTFTPDFEILPGTAPTQRQVPPGRPSESPSI